MEEDGEWFKKVKERVDRLLGACYGFEDRNEDGVQKGSEEDGFFSKQVKDVADSSVYVHVKGIQEKLSAEFCFHHRGLITGGHREDVKYIELRPLAIMPPDK